MATNHEKQKRGSFISFYKSGSIAGNYAQTHDPMAPVPAAAASNNINKPRSWLNMKKLRSGGVAAEIKRVDDRSIIASKEGGGRGGQVIVEGRRSFSHTETCSRLPVDREKVMVAARRSVSDQVESTNVASVISFLQVKVLVSDMPGFMQVHAFQCARRTYDSLEKFSSKHMAYNMKKEFDKVYGPAWHCIVGSSFGSFVTHGTGCFLYFSMEKLYVLLFKTKVQRALD